MSAADYHLVQRLERREDEQHWKALGEYLSESFLLPYADEGKVRDAVAKCLTDARLQFVRDCALGPNDLVDFLVDGRVAVAVAMHKTFAELARRVVRYAAHHDVREIVVVTMRAMHKALPREVSGKPVRVLYRGSPA